MNEVGDTFISPTRYSVVSMHTLTFTIGVLSCCSLCHAQKEASPVLKEKLPYTFQLSFHDEFNGQSLNLKKWRYEREGVQRAGFWTKDAVEVRNGNLVMHARYQKEKKRYITGDISTAKKFSQKYGYWEARVKLQSQEGFWSAFWLMPNQHLNEKMAPEKGLEIDIFEKTSVSNNVIYSTLHWHGYGKHHKSRSLNYSVAGIRDGFHTYGLLWTAEGYRYFIDGTEVARMARNPNSPLLQLPANSAIKAKAGYPICHAPLYPRLSCAFSAFDSDGHIKKAWGVGGKRPAKNIQDSWEVDYIRVYQVSPSK